MISVFFKIDHFRFSRNIKKVRKVEIVALRDNVKVVSLFDKERTMSDDIEAHMKRLYSRLVLDKNMLQKLENYYVYRSQEKEEKGRPIIDGV